MFIVVCLSLVVTQKKKSTYVRVFFGHDSCNLKLGPKVFIPNETITFYFLTLYDTENHKLNCLVYVKYTMIRVITCPGKPGKETVLPVTETHVKGPGIT